MLIIFLILAFNLIFLFLNYNENLFFAEKPAKPQAPAKPQVPSKPPTQLAKPRQAPAKPLAIASSNPAYTAGANGWTWDKFAKINPSIAKDPNAKQQFQQGQTLGKNAPSTAYTAGTSGQSWNSFAAKNPNVANVPGVQSNFQKGLQTFQNQVKATGMTGQSWSDFSKKNPQVASVPGAQQLFNQGQQYASTVKSKDFPKPPSSINTRDPTYSAFKAAVDGVPWSEFSKYGSTSNSPFPVPVPGGHPQSKIPGAQQAYEMGKQYASQVNQYANSSAYGAGASGQSWEQYVQNNPNANNVPGAQDLYNQGVNYTKNLPRGTYSSDHNKGGSGEGILAAGAAGLLPILLGMFLL